MSACHTQFNKLIMIDRTFYGSEAPNPEGVKASEYDVDTDTYRNLSSGTVTNSWCSAARTLLGHVLRSRYISATVWLAHACLCMWLSSDVMLVLTGWLFCYPNVCDCGLPRLCPGLLRPWPPACLLPGSLRRSGI